MITWKSVKKGRELCKEKSVKQHKFTELHISQYIWYKKLQKQSMSSYWEFRILNGSFALFKAPIVP